MANQPYIQGTVTVGTTATLVASPGWNSGTSGIYITNTGSVTLVLGGATVTASGATAGPTLAAGASILLPTAGPVHDLYGIVASGTTTVAYIYPA